MTDDTRIALRQSLEILFRWATAPGAYMRPSELQSDRVEDKNCHMWIEGVVVPLDPDTGSAPDFPPLGATKNFALSVLVGETDIVIANALADYLLDRGHEYAQACFEKGRAQGREEERRRCLAVVDKEEALCQYDTPPFTALAEVREMIASGYNPASPPPTTPPDPPPEPR